MLSTDRFFVCRGAVRIDAETVVLGTIVGYESVAKLYDVTYYGGRVLYRVNSGPWTAQQPTWPNKLAPTLAARLAETLVPTNTA